MVRLDYHKPEEPRPATRVILFLLAFVGAGILGSILVAKVDEYLCRRHGRHSDGTIALLGLWCLVPAGLILLPLRGFLGEKRAGIWIAFVAGLGAPAMSLLLWLL